LLVALSCLNAFAQNPESVLTLTRDDLEINLKLSNTTVFFADTVPMSVTLKSRRTVETFDLNTAWLYFQLKRFEKGTYVAREELGWFRTLGGTYQYRISKSGMHRLVQMKQTKLAMNTGDMLTRRFELNDLMGEFTYPGRYMLCVSYEWQIKDSIQIKVPLNYDKAIPRLLDNMQYSNNEHGRISPFRAFTYLTGYGMKDKAVPSGEEPKLVPLLRGWWSRNKQVILNVEAILNKKEYRNLDYSKRMDMVIGALESSDHSRRAMATAEFKNLTTVTLPLPAAADSDDVIRQNVRAAQQWWEQNKDLVTWISRVVIENQL